MNSASCIGKLKVKGDRQGSECDNKHTCKEENASERQSVPSKRSKTLEASPVPRKVRALAADRTTSIAKNVKRGTPASFSIAALSSDAGGANSTEENGSSDRKTKSLAGKTDETRAKAAARVTGRDRRSSVDPPRSSSTATTSESADSTKPNKRLSASLKERRASRLFCGWKLRPAEASRLKLKRLGGRLYDFRSRGGALFFDKIRGRAVPSIGQRVSRLRRTAKLGKNTVALDQALSAHVSLVLGAQPDGYTIAQNVCQTAVNVPMQTEKKLDQAAGVRAQKHDLMSETVKLEEGLLDSAHSASVGIAEPRQNERGDLAYCAEHPAVMENTPLAYSRTDKQAALSVVEGERSACTSDVPTCSSEENTCLFRAVEQTSSEMTELSFSGGASQHPSCRTLQQSTITGLLDPLRSTEDPSSSVTVEQPTSVGTQLQLSLGPVERPTAPGTEERLYLSDTVRDSVCGIAEESSLCGTMEKNSGCGTVEKKSGHGAEGKKSVCVTVERSSASGTAEQSTSCATIEKNSVCATVEKSSSHGTVEPSPGFSRVEQPSVSQTMKQSSVSVTEGPLSALKTVDEHAMPGTGARKRVHYDSPKQTRSSVEENTDEQRVTGSVCDEPTVDTLKAFISKCVISPQCGQGNVAAELLLLDRFLNDSHEEDLECSSLETDSLVGVSHSVSVDTSCTTTAGRGEVDLNGGRTSVERGRNDGSVTETDVPRNSLDPNDDKADVTVNCQRVDSRHVCRCDTYPH
ncbi:PREDICTED: uncharacterized protein LOC106811890 [Priapulus caudatus]|uniref:Uncharacterized protein LOC106811890 n=1 Tax=Priapulus caudatus TaxID=37621 RepID=A0ABM1EFX6_PRICU|nr:PREDICTED: uncharacterized protein LOC106811890 [Priapulus caudatus]